MKSLRNRELAQIHLGKKALGLDDETYRAMIFAIGRVKSSAELDAAGRRRVIEHMAARGASLGRQRAKVDSPQIHKIRALWAGLADRGVVRDGSDRAIDHFVRRQTGRDSIRWLNTAESERVIEALKAWSGRVDVGTDARQCASPT